MERISPVPAQVLTELVGGTAWGRTWKAQRLLRIVAMLTELHISLWRTTPPVEKNEDRGHASLPSKASHQYLRES
jgi:hypothetical protein